MGKRVAMSKGMVATSIRAVKSIPISAARARAILPSSVMFDATNSSVMVCPRSRTVSKRGARRTASTTPCRTRISATYSACATELIRHSTRSTGLGVGTDPGRARRGVGTVWPAGLSAGMAVAGDAAAAPSPLPPARAMLGRAMGCPGSWVLRPFGLASSSSRARSAT